MIENQNRNQKQNGAKAVLFLERRRDEVSELLSKDESKGYGICVDEVKLIRAQGECLGIKSRRRT